VAAEGADQIVVTDDNPRGEDPEAITAAILAGVQQAGAARRVRVIHDRGDAIAYATSGAAGEDVVLVAGKGHEDYQLIGPSRRPFSDTAWVRGALARRRSA
jgi:UDP-N-acetylmuramoyl-L-alanyl-D-glutamate--2,6-diaminopimelate ligase